MRNLIPLVFLASLPLLAACGGQTAGSTPLDGGADGGPSTGDSGPITTCVSPFADCNGVCVETSTDPNNCGACGRSCGADGACVQGNCVSTLPTQPADAGLPPNPGGPTPTGTADLTVAIHTLYMGDTDRNGVQSAVAWEQYGLNVDGKVTTGASTDVCTLYAGAARATQIDGAGGVDNSFGENIIPIVITVSGNNYSTTLNANVAAGLLGTTMFSLGDVGAGADYAPLVGASFKADATSTPPAWGGADVWPIDSSSVSNGSVTNPIVTFAQSYMNNRVWVSAPSSATQAVPINFLNGTSVPVRHAQLVMTVADDNSKATNGTFSGVILTTDLISVLQSVAGNISTSLCSAQAFASIATQISQASDIMSDGSNEPGETCDAISIGLGFDAVAAKLGSVVTPTPPANPCAP